MILAGDLGGTKTLLGLFERGERRPRHILARAYPTQEFDGFTAMLDAFARDLGRPLEVDAAAIGVAGPVVDRRAQLPHVRWDVSATAIGEHLRTKSILLLNDLEAMAMSVPVLSDRETITLQPGIPKADGNAAVIAAGTGLGEAYLHRVNGSLLPLPSQGGHADFAPRNEREIGLLHMLVAQFGRAQVEHVLSGPGLVNIHRFTHAGASCDAVDGRAPSGMPAAISEAALSRGCSRCEDALAIFVEAYGAEAGNLGLRGIATAGVFVGGGIAPKILPALQDGRFIAAFCAKAPMSELVAAMPVSVIVKEDAGLLGAAIAAQDLST